MKQRNCILVFFLLFSLLTYSQSIVSGVVTDEKGEAIFAASIYLKSDITKGVITDLEGSFELEKNEAIDTIVVSFIGYESIILSLDGKSETTNLKIILKEKGYGLSEITILGRDPISESFSVEKIEKLEIYFDPFAQGDALKAITSLPSSTHADESANPSLRGSSASRSNVIFNGVPVYSPIRNSQINGIGNFSIFNTEIIDKQYIYASNPPLSYGNSSAGLIEIESISKLDHNELQISSTLASIGAFASRSLGKDVFVQGFSNFQFSGPFTTINNENLENLNSFGSIDAGLNIRWNLTDKLTYNSFSYFIDENYDVNLNLYSHRSNGLSANRRFFNIQNLYYQLPHGKFTINYGYSRATSNFNFGNLYTNRQDKQDYLSANYKHIFDNGLTIQAGVSSDRQSFDFIDTVPIFYYALRKEDPSTPVNNNSANNLNEAYVYSFLRLGDYWKSSVGLRSNFNQLAYQFGLSYLPDSRHKLLFNAGSYYSFSRPNFNDRAFTLMESKQIAIDYEYIASKYTIQAAAYFKNENGERTIDFIFPIEKVTTYGLEFFLSYEISRYFLYTFSNSLIEQRQIIYEQAYRGAFDYAYFVKSAIQFVHPKMVNFTISYIGRPGNQYNEILGSTFRSEINFYEPTFSQEIYGATFNNYNRIDLTFNKYLSFNKNALILFASFANVLDFKNQQSNQYNADYSILDFTYFQRRSMFFGMVWSIK